MENIMLKLSENNLGKKNLAEKRLRTSQGAGVVAQR